MPKIKLSSTTVESGERMVTTCIAHNRQVVVLTKNVIVHPPRGRREVSDCESKYFWIDQERPNATREELFQHSLDLLLEARSTVQ